MGVNILLVAPEHPDLPNVLAEVAAVSEHHDVVRLVGVVRDADIARAVDEGPYDLIWFASHGGADGVLLSDGALSVAGVGQYVKASGARLCVLNTCSSEYMALRIVAGGDADMICTIAEVGDRDAMRLAILLAGELARTENFYEAYLQVRPEGGHYRYYRAGPGAPRRHDDQREAHEMLSMIYELRSDMKVLRTWLAIMALGMALLALLEVALWYRVA